MKTTEDIFACITVLTTLCSCALAYQSNVFKHNSNTRELEALVSELRRELQINLDQNNAKDVFKVNNLPDNSKQTLEDNDDHIFKGLSLLGETGSRRGSILSTLLSRKENIDDHGVNKRQGGWDYDYGLGGGRFGKRSGMFGDYSLGGGRFGRDVSHVENIDINENMDFEDV